MNLKQKILKLALTKQKITTQDIASKQQVSRQFANRIIAKLVKEGKLVKIGSTKSAFYALPKNLSKLGLKVRKRFKNKNLEEHEILFSFKKNFPLIKQLQENVTRIFDYAFSEMVNNAIEHSSSKFIEIEVQKEKNNKIKFIVNDSGIGAFNSIIKKRKLHSELEAIQDLLKGKTTTKPKLHSGEGIFFTSKIADIFILESSNYRLRIDNTINDTFIEPLEKIKNGTKVEFLIDINSNKTLKILFQEFQVGDEYSFNKTEIKIKLYALGTEYISRSQARRLLWGLEKFKLIILDFEEVKTVGQAFADEVFRIFKQKYPEIKIKAINTNKTIDFMIKRAEN